MGETRATIRGLTDAEIEHLDFIAEKEVRSRNELLLWLVRKFLAARPQRKRTA